MDYVQLKHPLYYINLVFIAFPVVGAITQTYPTYSLFLTLGFVLSYLYTIFGKSEWKINLTWTYMILYVLYMTLCIEYSMIWFLFYFNSLLAFRFKDSLKSFRMLSYLLTILMIVIVGLWNIEDTFVRMIVILIPLFNCSMLYFFKKEANYKRQKDELIKKNESINLLLADNERNRIGQDLHDTLGHVFALLSVKSELLKTLIEHEQLDQAKKEANEILVISKQTMNDIRSIVHSLKNHQVEEELVILSNMLEMANVELIITNRSLPQQLSLEKQGKLAMILREFMTNLIKHSQATQCQLHFNQQKHQLILDYQDNGIGFREWRGNELQAVKNRLVTMQATLEVISLKNPTHFRLMIPMEENS
ncbi:sensor histidine kinase [Atopobacter phocae]|uniref:sensor histidine kinase n=1 Tax=Atopobacter phocae TaxID=136492 RepID=UPI000472E523|nr:histidine kinase [Atopobacter phocae]